jgi:probable HAF family extracellular repeat protein
VRNKRVRRTVKLLSLAFAFITLPRGGEDYGTKERAMRAVLVALLLLSHADAAEFYFLGDTQSASGVSPDGSMVLVNADNHNFSIWTEAGGITPILTGEIWPRDITNDGVVVGLHCGGGTGSCYEAFRWTSAGGLVGLGGGFGSDANGVSADGSVVVGNASSDTSGFPFRWTSQSGIVPLGNLGGGENSLEEANGVSADGAIVVGQSGSPSGPQAFRWTQATGMVGLGDLPGGDFFSDARAISSNGTVIVGESKSAGGSEAFRWTAAGGMQGLGHVQPGNSGQALAATADGTVIVGRDATAFYWTEASGMRSLAEVLINEYGLGPQLAGWTLHEARDISDDGRVIIGYGTSPTGDSGGWIAVIPEPSAPALVFVASIMVVLSRRRNPAR